MRFGRGKLTIYLNMHFDACQFEYLANH